MIDISLYQREKYWGLVIITALLISICSICPTLAQSNGGIHISNVFNPDWTLAPYDPAVVFYVECKAPVNYAPVKFTLNALDECRKPLKKVPGAVAPISKEITLNKVESTDRYDLFRSNPIQITQEVYPDPATVPELPMDREIIQGIVGGFIEVIDFIERKTLIRCIRRTRGIQFLDSDMGQLINYIPVFMPDDGKGRGPRGDEGPSLMLTFEKPISTEEIDVVTAAYFRGIDMLSIVTVLTETLKTSLIFSDPENTFTVKITEMTGMDPAIRDTLKVSLTINMPRLKITDKEFILREIGIASLEFAQERLEVNITFSTIPDPAAPDTIEASISSNLESHIIKETLTETENNSNIFKSPDGKISITIIPLPPFDPNVEDQMSPTVTIADWNIVDETILLLETKKNSLFFNNKSRVPATDLPPLKPYKERFFVRVWDPAKKAQSIIVTLKSSVETKQIDLKAIDRGIFQSPPIVAVPESVQQLPTYKGLENLIVLKTSATLDATQDISALYVGDDEARTQAVKGAFVGRHYWADYLITPGPSPTGYYHINAITEILRNKLGYPVLKDQSTDRKDLKNSVKDKSICYLFTHGLTDKDEQGERYFVGPKMDSWYFESDEEAVADPSDIGSTGPHHFKLVFFNCCYSGNDHPWSNARPFAVAFGITQESEEGVYLGWTLAPANITAFAFGEGFFEELDTPEGKEVKPTVKEAVDKIIEDIPALDLGDIRFIGNSGVKIDRKK